MLFHLRSAFVFFLVLVVFLAPAVFSFAQDRDDARSLEHVDYDRWNTINASAISNDGRWAMYSVRDGKDKVTHKFRQLTSNGSWILVYPWRDRLPSLFLSSICYLSKTM